MHNIHNMSQSTVAGPYLQQYNHKPAQSVISNSQRNGGNPQPIV